MRFRRRTRVAIAEPAAQQFAEQRARRDFEAKFCNVVAPAGVDPYSCPCCGHRTLTERGAYEICAECGWEDDGQDDHDSHVVRGGPNGRESLDEARCRYVEEIGEPLPHCPPVEPR